jgi:hypothetical protein
MIKLDKGGGANAPLTIESSPADDPTSGANAPPPTPHEAPAEPEEEEGEAVEDMEQMFQPYLKNGPTQRRCAARLEQMFQPTAPRLMPRRAWGQGPTKNSFPAERGLLPARGEPENSPQIGSGGTIATPRIPRAGGLGGIMAPGGAQGVSARVRSRGHIGRILPVWSAVAQRPRTSGGLGTPRGMEDLHTWRWRGSCNGPQTRSLGLANKGSFQPAIRANKRSRGPTISANELTLIATSLQTAM